MAVRTMFGVAVAGWLTMIVQTSFAADDGRRDEPAVTDDGFDPGHMLNVARFGAKGDGRTDDSDALVAADQAAATQQIRLLYFPPGTFRAPSIGRQNSYTRPTGYLPHTILVGRGELVDSRYRRVVPLNAPPPPPAGDTLKDQLWTALRWKDDREPLVIDIMGDSTCTEGANPYARTTYLAPALERKFHADNPGRTIEFKNRCIGAEDWTAANGIAKHNQPPWYRPLEKAWFDFVAEDRPDVLVFDFGMNPGPNGIDVEAVRALMTKAVALTPRPAVMLATNMQPSLDPRPGFAPYPVDQERRFVSAGFQRTFAKAYGYGLIDVNRRMQIVRDGIDPVEQRDIDVLKNSEGQHLPFALPLTEGDFKLKVAVTSLWASADKLTMQIGNRDDNVAILSRDRRNGQVSLEVYAGASFLVLRRSVADEGSQEGTRTLDFAMRQGTLTIRYDGSRLCDDPVPQMGGPFGPTLSATGPGAGDLLITVSGTIGQGKTYMPLVTDAEIYRNNDRLGGNGVNHVNALGIEKIVTPVVEALDLRIKK